MVEKHALGIECATFFLRGTLYMLHTHNLINKEVLGLVTKQV
jgi:hypothetical protein